jgi:hypothetical protein
MIDCLVKETCSFADVSSEMEKSKSLFSRILLFIFFACPKKTNQKKGQPITRHFAAGSTVSNFPALLKTPGSLKTRFAQTGPNSFFGRYCRARRREMALTGVNY